MSLDAPMPLVPLSDASSNPGIPDVVRFTLATVESSEENTVPGGTLVSLDEKVVEPAAEVDPEPWVRVTALPLVLVLPLLVSLALVLCFFFKRSCSCIFSDLFKNSKIHGSLKNCSTVYLCIGLTVSNFETQCLAPLEISSHHGDKNLNSPLATVFVNSSIESLKNGGNPHNKMYNTHPNAHMSTSLEYLISLTISGAV